MKINSHYYSAEAAARIQATVRGHKGRVVVAKAWESYNLKKNVTLIAALWRGRMARKLVKERKLNEWLRETAAIKLQCFFRYHLAKVHVQRLKDKRWMAVAPYAATKIQRVYRGMKGRERVLKQKENALLLIEKQQRFCVKIQSFVRMLSAKKIKHKLKLERMRFEQLQLLSAIKMQSSWRMWNAINIRKKLKLDLQRREREKSNAANTMYRILRSFQFRKRIEAKVQYRIMLNTMATKIALWYRGLVLKHRLKVEAQAKFEVLQSEASTLLQKYWRRKHARNLFCVLKREFEAQKQLKSQKALVITSWCRMCLAKLRVRILKKEHREYLKLRFRVETDAATQIQSCWRGYKGRLVANEVLISKKSRWKKIWSEEDGRFFFYNQVS